MMIEKNHHVKHDDSALAKRDLTSLNSICLLSKMEKKGGWLIIHPLFMKCWEADSNIYVMGQIRSFRPLTDKTNPSHGSG